MLNVIDLVIGRRFELFPAMALFDPVVLFLFLGLVVVFILRFVLLVLLSLLKLDRLGSPPRSSLG